MSHDPFLTIGNSRLCAWRIEAGDIRVQTRLPELAKKLGARQDAKLIAWSVKGGYLRIFRFDGKTMAWAERLINRYEAWLKRTGGAKTDPNRPSLGNNGQTGQTV